MSEHCTNCGCASSHGEILDDDGYCDVCAADADNEYNDRACCRACGVRISDGECEDNGGYCNDCPPEPE